MTTPFVVTSVSFVSALTTAILPVLAIAGVGFVLGRFREVSVEPLSTVTIFILTPALVFSSLVNTELGGEAILTLVVGVVAFTVAMVGLSEAAARAVGETGPLRSGLVLTSTFSNAGNYGIPLSAFAFGAVGRSTAVLYIAVQAVLMYTIGVYVASRGTSGHWADAIIEVFKLPLVYAVLLAGLVRALGVVPPAEGTVMQTVTLTGDSAIPVMLVMLGIQLANTNYGSTITRVWVPTALKMAVAPVAALAIALGIGFEDPVVGRVFVLECAMPAAITPLMLTIEYGGEGTRIDAAEYVSTTIMVTTVVSVPVLAVLIGVLQSGAVL
ncbi:permease [Halanaeroarchaeum sulfurireducens]|uniref:Permease n=1 Tax=Halanaeroarchaeum sulfurireducens TaxID=1604004 RepID=A0A0F7PCL2_9EURY|nr:permease [Halanaeroarchaeum sulfurireducens]